MGAQQAASIDHEQGVSFELGGEKVRVLILRPEDLTQRNSILDAILNLSALKYTHQLVYLAAPRLFGASVDAIAFRSRGIGLLFYDERRIDEAVPAQPLQLEQADRHLEEDISNHKTVVAELATLKTMYLQMEHTINQLRNDLMTLQNPHPVSEETFKIISPTHVITSPASFQDQTHLGGLPSYFVNNPWLDVLSKRGSGGREQIAG